jgi:hypothetical protein
VSANCRPASLSCPSRGSHSMSWWSQRRRWLMRRATGAEGVSVNGRCISRGSTRPRRTLTELGDGGRQGEQSLTPAGAPGAPDGCHRLSNRPGDHELESVAFHVEQRCREGRLSPIGSAVAAAPYRGWPKGPFRRAHEIHQGQKGRALASTHIRPPPIRNGRGFCQPRDQPSNVRCLSWCRAGAFRLQAQAEVPGGE